ncbi:uncharacterized protein TNCV_1332931 [Trichonephila clavipes]|nr:uncharacterized protein TNCV_1332931 [Trichonephila clavipes]
MQRLPGSIFQQGNARTYTRRVTKDCLRTVTTLPDLSPIEYIWTIGTASSASQEFERTRGKVTVYMKRNVSRHHAELVGLNARSYRIVHWR